MLEKLKSKLFTGTFTGFLAALPTTNFRIFVTMFVFMGTAVRYFFPTTKAWEPSWEWLMFLTVMAGIDAAQYANKRKTAWRPTEVAEVVATVEEAKLDEQERG